MGAAASVHSGSGEAEPAPLGLGEAESARSGSGETGPVPSVSGEATHAPRLGLMLGRRRSFSQWAILNRVATRLGRDAQFRRTNP
jgi:hypothetical protein